MPAEIGQLTSLRLYLTQQLTSCRRRSAAHVAESCLGGNRADERAGGDRAAHLAEELASTQQADEPAGGDRAAHLADELRLEGNQLTSVPAEIGQLTSLRSCTSAAIS